MTAKFHIKAKVLRILMPKGSWISKGTRENNCM